MESRFNHIQYDIKAQDDQGKARYLASSLETFIVNIGIMQNKLPSVNCSRAKSLAITKLEECYMWIGKALKEDQLDRQKEE